MDEKEIIRRHYQSMAKKSHEAVRLKYGKDYYSKIQKIRWKKYRLAKSLKETKTEGDDNQKIEGENRNF